MSDGAPTFSGTLAASLLNDRLAGDLALYTAGLALGAEGRAALGALKLARLADAPRLILRESQTLGADSYTLWSLA